MAGAGIFAIAEGLTRDGIPCPSAHDPGRNKHRSGIAWSKAAVRVILTNPRYTVRQVWNRQRKDEVLIDVADVALGNVTKMRWNDASQWIWSDEVTHPPVIAAETFQQAWDILASRGRGPCQHRPHDRPRSYAFVGSLYCGVCQRRMQGQWINAAPYYRCRFPAEYALANKVSHPRNVYLRQDAFDTAVNTWLATAFAPARLSDTIDQIMAGQLVHADSTAAQAAMARIEDASVKMARYRAALDAGRKALKLRPLVAIFDEVQNVFLHPVYGKQAAEDAVHVIRLGRAYGVILVLSTQRPTTECLPAAVSGNVTARFCLQVPGQVENDLVLGTSSYKDGYKATAFRPKVDAGLGWLKADGLPQIVRTYKVDLPECEKIAARARVMRDRAGVLTGYAVTEGEAIEARAVLADVLAVFGDAPGCTGQSWPTGSPTGGLTGGPT